MRLATVTITGADDIVKHEDLAGLSAEFPFVEWGILVSSSRAGQARYPTEEWVRALNVPRWSAHLCGEQARQVMAGRAEHLRRLLEPAHHRGAGRVQINGWTAGGSLPSGTAMGAEWVLQCRDAVTLYDADHFRSTRLRDVRAAGLFDPSGGRGTEPFRWPKAATFAALTGFAGGIRPTNVATVVADIMAENLTACGDFWIDMESGVRTDDRFDLGLVREVLRITQPLVARP